ncbi:MAG: helix-hairpin-helix domain-containing protein [Defluviitaleaceae bacterium]|nr:helix-hairpin-helix domain-containing protein [Defluviitaleaceae bacterium]MCL2262783.1 helix-hairpin-helix domain-containing protein [Defluviitaleaceae bacterium]
MPKIKEFLCDHAFFLLGGLCIVVVGIVFAVSRAQTPEVVRDDGEVIFTAGAISETAGETGAYVAEVAASVPYEETDYIIIHVDGAVNEPGVFRLPVTARVDDALTKAGGAAEYANMAGINRAAFLQDGMKIKIPAQGEEAGEVFIFAEGAAQGGGATAAGSAPRSDGLVNINTATAAELQTLSGIGEARAQSIIRFRETHGNFSHIEELMNISGIGTGIMDRVRDSVTVD